MMSDKVVVNPNCELMKLEKRVARKICRGVVHENMMYCCIYPREIDFIGKGLKFVINLY